MPLALVIVIVLSYLMSLPMGRVLVGCSEDPSARTRFKVREFVQAYAHWTMATGELCPDTLSELNRYVNQQGTSDAWDRDLLMLCGGTLQAAKGIDFAVVSAGTDGYFGSTDDIQWPPR